MVDKTENLAEKYKKTEEELRILARDIVNGQVTTDRHCPSKAYFFQTFLTVGFKDNFALCKSFDKVTVYEYEDTPRPSGSFLTFKLIVNEDVDLLWKLVDELTTSMQNFLHPSQPGSSPESAINP